MKIEIVKDSDSQLLDVINPEVDKRISPPTYGYMLIMQGVLLLCPIIIATTQFYRKGWRYWITPYYYIE